MLGLAYPTVPCEMCAFTRRVGSIQLVCAMHEALWLLAHNLAVAGGLCASYMLGWVEYQRRRFGEESEFWQPGCGRLCP